MLTIHFYIDLFVGFIIAFMLWELIRLVVRKLDNRYDWLVQTVQRILLQLVFGVILPALLSFVFTLVIMRVLYQQDIFQTTWLQTEFYAVILLIILINLMYFTWWLFLHHMHYQKQAKYGNGSFTVDDYSKQTSEPVSIEVSKANVNYLLLPEEISYVFLENPYTFIRTHDEQQFVTTYALDDLQKKLGEVSFFRANRQVIISRKSCKSYRSIENGKISVDLNNPVPEPVIISQKRARDFRKWIQGAQISAGPDILEA